MSEPPVQVTAEGVEAHPPKVGHRHLDLLIAGAAILISITSLWVAVQHGKTMDRLVAANSWPLLRYDTGNLNEATNSPEIELMIENAGVGPAIVKRFDVSFAGRPIADQSELLAACCGAPGRNAVVVTEEVGNSVIRAGERRTYIRLADSPEVHATWSKLDRARFMLTFDACYCSVLGECWESDLTGVDARPVERCEAK